MTKCTGTHAPGKKGNSLFKIEFNKYRICLTS